MTLTQWLKNLWFEIVYMRCRLGLHRWVGHEKCLVERYSHANIFRDVKYCSICAKRKEGKRYVEYR